MSKIPFGWLPASWGLKGKSRELAEAEYYLLSILDKIGVRPYLK